MPMKYAPRIVAAVVMTVLAVAVLIAQQGTDDGSVSRLAGDAATPPAAALSPSPTDPADDDNAPDDVPVDDPSTVTQTPAPTTSPTRAGGTAQHDHSASPQSVHTTPVTTVHRPAPTQAPAAPPTTGTPSPAPAPAADQPDLLGDLLTGLLGP